MSGSLLQNPLLSINDPSQTGNNPLTQGSPTLADAFQYNANAAADWLQKQRDQSVAMGLWDPNTGLPTAQGVVNAGQQYAQGLLAGTTAPEFRTVPSLVPTPDLAPGEADRVSTRIPTAKAALSGDAPDPHTTADLNIGIDAAKASDPAYANNAAELGYYPDLPIKGLRNPDKVTDAAVGHMADNLVWLHDQMRDQFGQDLVARTANWYDGANTVATNLADANGYSTRQVAGAIANLSPQKDWYQNGDLARRMIDIVRNKSDTSLTPEMNDWATNYLSTAADNADTPSKQAAVGNLQMSLSSLQRGPTLGEINDPDTRALFVRAYDEAHNSRDYPMITPEGDFGDTMTNADGSPRQIAWGSFTEIKKALSALDGPDDLASISASLGGNHKVRSFYNNIISPDSSVGDTTIDTHAIAAAHLRPLGGGDQVVANGLGLGGSSDATTGSRGMYGLYHEAYRQAADRLGLLPRQMQSIAWEGVRGLFSPEQKRDNGFYNQNYDIWQGFRNGQYSADEARNAVLDQAGGINPPSWWTPPPEPQTQ